jgi:DNA repair exonuclease SbcCD nuclease subunit
MSRFLAISDVHAHPFPYGARYVPYKTFKGMHNSRLVDILYALEEAADYAVANDIRTVLFGGDLYHTRQAVKTVARNMVTAVIKTQFVDRGLTLVMIPGNHDYADRVGNIHSLQSLDYLSTRVHVLDTVTSLDVGDITVFSVPYTDDVVQARDSLKFAASQAATRTDRTTVLLGHFGIQGATVGSDYVMLSPTDVTGDEIPFASFDACFFGHYHQHQVVAKNAWYIGALTEQNWSDAGGKRGFLDVQIGNKVSIKRIETSAPKFVVCTTLEELQAAPSNAFVTFFTDTVPTEEQQVVLRETCASAQLEIKPVKTKQTTPELAFDAAQLNAETALKPWVVANAGDLDQEALLQLGRELLSLGQDDEVQTD